MNVFHIRAERVSHRGAITVDYDLDEGAYQGASIGLAFCAPGDAFRRDRGRAIAAARLASNPLRLGYITSVEGTDELVTIDHHEVRRALAALIVGRPKWRLFGASAKPKLHHWKAEILAPNGVYVFGIESREQQQVPALRDISWLHVPSWASTLIPDTSP